MELYIFLITHLIQLSATLVIVFSYISDDMPPPLCSTNGIKGERTIRRLKKLKIYLKIRTENALEFMMEIKNSQPGPTEKKTGSAIGKSVTKQKAMVLK